jgi:hypothetical protein
MWKPVDALSPYVIMTNMSANTARKKALGTVETVLDENLSDAEMDRLLAERRDEIESKLDEAYAAKARGDSAPLEPLHVFLRRARERLKATG